MQFSVLCMVGHDHRDPTPFGSTDFWSVFTDEGQCAPYSGGTGNASSHICNALDDYFAPYYCHVWTNVEFINVESDLLDYGWLDFNPEGITLFTADDLSREIEVKDLLVGQYFYRIMKKEKLLGVGAWVKQ
jgi:hypothetical protein